MKKMFLSFLILLSFSFINILGVNADVLDGELDFTVFDNEKYDLITGIKSNDINYSITNKIQIHPNNLDDEIDFSTVDFHHVLFFSKTNAYMGYANTEYSSLELSTYIGYDVITDAPTGSVVIPEGVNSIALMSYNYDDTRNMVIKEYDSIDAIAFGNLTYRDIFEGNQLILNPDFDDVTPTEVFSRNLFDGVVQDGGNNTLVALSPSSFTLYNLGGGVSGFNVITNASWLPNTQYTFSGDHIEDTENKNARLNIIYTDLTNSDFPDPTTVISSYNITSEVGKTIKEIAVIYSTGVDLGITTYTNFQIELGTVASDYVEHSRTADLADNWVERDSFKADVIDGVYTQLQNDVNYMYVNQALTIEDNNIYYNSLIYNDNSITHPQFYFDGDDKVYFQELEDITNGYNSYMFNADKNNTNVTFRLSDPNIGATFNIDDVDLYDITTIYGTNLEEYGTVNLYDKNTTTSGGIDINGDPFGSALYDRSDFIAVDSNTTYAVTGNDSFHFYDSSKDYLGTGTYDIPSSTVISETGASYMRISFYLREFITRIYQVELGTVLGDYVERYDLEQMLLDFEVYKSYYFLNKDVSGQELTYNDVYDETQIVNNGDFSDGINNWTVLTGMDVDTDNDELHSINTQSGNLGVQYFEGDNPTFTFDIGDILYYSLDVEVITAPFYQSISTFRPLTATGFNSYLYTVVNESEYLYLRHGAFAETIIDNVRVYNHTNIYTAGHEPTIETFEANYLVYVDPLEDGYNAYHPAIGLIIMEITYQYEDNSADPPSAIGGIEEALLKMGIDTDELKVFTGIVIMIVMAIAIGLSTNSLQVTVMSEIALTVVFTMLGWFSFWILLIIALLATLIIILKGIQGGNE